MGCELEMGRERVSGGAQLKFTIVTCNNIADNTEQATYSHFCPGQIKTTFGNLFSYVRLSDRVTVVEVLQFISFTSVSAYNLPLAM